MKYAFIAAVGIAGTAIAAPVQPQGERGPDNGQGGDQGHGNPDPTITSSTSPAWETTAPAWGTTTPAWETTSPAWETTAPAWETTTPAWETTPPPWESQTATVSWPTSLPWTSVPWGVPTPSGWPTGWPGKPSGWPTPSVSTTPTATPNLPICPPELNRLPNADEPPIECINMPPVTNPGGPIEPLDRNTGPKRRSILDWFKGNNKEDKEDNKDNTDN